MRFTLLVGALCALVVCTAADTKEDAQLLMKLLKWMKELDKPDRQLKSVKVDTNSIKVELQKTGECVSKHCLYQIRYYEEGETEKAVMYPASSKTLDEFDGTIELQSMDPGKKYVLESWYNVKGEQIQKKGDVTVVELATGRTASPTARTHPPNTPTHPGHTAKTATEKAVTGPPATAPAPATAGV